MNRTMSTGKKVAIFFQSLGVALAYIAVLAFFFYPVVDAAANVA